MVSSAETVLVSWELMVSSQEEIIVSAEEMLVSSEAILVSWELMVLTGTREGWRIRSLRSRWNEMRGC